MLAGAEAVRLRTSAYCEGSPEVAAGGDELSCLEPQHWFSESVIAAVLILLEVAVVVVFAAAIHRQRRQQR